MKHIELLAPAGNLEKLKVAITYGADAVYMGGASYGLRAMAGNFTSEEMREGLLFAHERGCRVFITVNIFAHNEDLIGLPEYIKELEQLGVDGVIVSDLGIFSVIQETAPGLEIHISTQANNVNYKTAEFWHKLGAKRVVLGREMSLSEITELRAKTPPELELEAFIHGAMCMSYSGRCLLSNYMTGRDANRGACAHPCRYKYYLVEEKRPGEYYPVEEDERGTYIMNSHDLCMIEHIPEIVNSGITSFKIEGRMKSAYYVATVVKAYRQALDAFTEQQQDYQFQPEWAYELSKASHREYSTGFYFGKPEKQIYGNSSYIRTHDIVGIVLDYDETTQIATVEQRNRVFKGEAVEILTPKQKSFSVILSQLWDQDGVELDAAPHPQMIYRFRCETPLKPYDMLVKEKEE